MVARTMIMTFVSLVIVIMILSLVFGRGVVGTTFDYLTQTKADLVALELNTYLVAASYMPGTAQFSMTLGPGYVFGINETDTYERTNRQGNVYNLTVQKGETAELIMIYPSYVYEESPSMVCKLKSGDINTGVVCNQPIQINSEQMRTELDEKSKDIYIVYNEEDGLSILGD